MYQAFQGVVERSGELRRVAALPRRLQPPEGTERLTEVLRAPGGTQELRPLQAQALAELYCCRGLLGPITVGGGKTLVTYLAPLMVGAKVPLLLVPAKLREKTRRDFAALAEHWTPGEVPLVYSYEMLGREGAARFLDELQPDLIIADEAHRLKNVRAAVTRRVGRYMTARPGTLFVALSGTMTKRSLMDFAHLAEWALGQGSPLPLRRFDLEQWAMALDEVNQWGDARLDPGALFELDKMTQETPGDMIEACRLFGAGPIERARSIFQCRFAETPGVVVTHGEGFSASLVISDWEHGVERPEAVDEAFRVLHDRWETPDGRPLIAAVDVWRHARELAQGFSYRWDPPPPAEWLEARRAWAAFARAVLAGSRTLDSEAQVAKAHARSPEWKAWDTVRRTFEPTVVADWLTPRYIEAAARWARQAEGIVWAEHRAVGEALEAEGLAYYGRMGLDAQGRPIEDARGGIVASIAANSEGRNLQHYSRNLVLSPPTTGDRWEQMLGRTHREGQMADTVEVEVYLGCEQSVEGFCQALSDARYQRGVTGSPQKLLLADIAFSHEGSR